MTDFERRIAHYNLLEPVGSGGLGEVFRARDTKVGRTVALKLLPQEITRDPRQIEALFADARRASTLSHPSIATLFDLGVADGVHYLAYEFVSGVPLGNEMAGRPMNPRRALEIAVQVADALSDAHAAGIVHGDVRPETIALTGKGNAKLLETGMTRWTRGGRLRRIAAENPGTLPPHAVAVASYLSPEQALGSRVDGRSDLFSVASVLYEMLTGRNEFTSGSVQDSVMRVISHHPSAPSSVNSGVPRGIDAILARAMSKDISKRHENMASFAAELRGVMPAPEQRASPHAGSYVMPVDDRADRTPVAVMLAGLAGVIAVAAVVWWALS
jgi:eukaryotic-like serine/threonine-protein kinase